MELAAMPVSFSSQAGPKKRHRKTRISKIKIREKLIEPNQIEMP
jgi:hypothetical protein